MEKSSKKSKHKTLNFKKHINPLLMSIEEYNKAMEVIPKEIEKNKEFHEFEEKILKVYEEIKSATNEYCEKMKDISKQLNPNEKNTEGKIQKMIYDALTNVSEAIYATIKRFEDDKKNNINTKIYEDYNSIFDSFNKEYSQKIEILDKTRKSYLNEAVKYEAYLINKELGLLESINNNENNKKENKKKKDKNIPLNDNHSIVCDLQEQYLKSKLDIKGHLKKIFCCINTERKLVFQTLKQNSENLVRVINLGLKKLNELIKEQSNNYEINPISDSEDLFDEENTINNILKDDLYKFKFLSINKIKEKEENNENKNKKKKKEKKDNTNVDSLLEQLTNENIMNLLNDLTTNKIKYNEENKQKVTLLENKKKIEELIQLIIDDPNKFIKENKSLLYSLLESTEDNQISFMQYLNNYRANGAFDLKKLTINIFCDLFIFIVDMAVKTNNYKLIQYALILSLTYYHIEEDKNKNEKNDEEKKIYMTKYLKESNSFHQKEFWINYLQALINDEIEKLNKRKEITISDKQKSVAVYSSAFTLIKNMIDYELDFDFINKILEEICNKNKFKDTEKQDIVNFLLAETQNKKEAK